ARTGAVHRGQDRLRRPDLRTDAAAQNEPPAPPPPLEPPPPNPPPDEEGELPIVPSAANMPPKFGTAESAINPPPPDPPPPPPPEPAPDAYHAGYQAFVATPFRSSSA